MSVTQADKHILGILRSQRGALVKATTDMVFASEQTQIERESVEQLLRGILAIIEETLLGESTDLRRMYLDTALPEVARANGSSWRSVLSEGLPCWGVIVGLVCAQADESYRPEVVHRLSGMMGAWWAEVWDAMAPVFRSKGQL